MLSAPVNEHIRQEVRRLFTEYMTRMGQRKTPERFAILDEMYEGHEHIDAETLYLHMKEKNYRISRATVYNTLDLLVEAGLVTRHQFGKNQARYEGSYGNRQHDHMICNRCSDIIEFCDPRIQQIKNMMGELLHFEVTDHSLHLYGQPKLDAEHKCVNCKRVFAEEK